MCDDYSYYLRFHFLLILALGATVIAVQLFLGSLAFDMGIMPWVASIVAFGFWIAVCKLSPFSVVFVGGT